MARSLPDDPWGGQSPSTPARGGRDASPAHSALAVIILTAALACGACRRSAPPTDVPAEAAGVTSASASAPTDLPELGELEAFRRDQSAAREICRRLDLPDLPDIRDLDPDGQKQFHAMFTRLRNHPADADEFGLLGQLYEAQRFPARAEQLYHRAVAMDPDDYQWHYALALRLLDDGRAREAAAELERAAELKPDYAPVWMQLARRAFERNDVDAALTHIDRYIHLRPDDPFGYVQRAQIHSDANRPELMQRDLERAEDLQRRGKGHIGRQGHRLLGVLYHHLGQEDQSRFHLLMSAEPQPGGHMDDPVALTVRRLETSRLPELTRFNDLVDLGRYREAISLEPELLSRHREDDYYGGICARLSECYRHVGDYASARKWALEAGRVVPGQPAPYAAMALIYLHTGRFAQALEAAGAALSLDPDLHTAHYARGLTLVQIAVAERKLPPERRTADPEARVRSALPDLEACVKQKPVNLSYLVALATAHALLGHYDEADRLLTTALWISPDDANTRALKAKAERRESFWP